VYSNLFRVRRDHWTLFERPGVSLATFYYADTDEGHDEVTGREGSHAATRANIIEAHRRSIRVRVGIVDVLDGQRVEEARAELEGLGITECTSTESEPSATRRRAPVCRPRPSCAAGARGGPPRFCRTGP
jgi:hypothetical protein